MCCLVPRSPHCKELGMGISQKLTGIVSLAAALSATPFAMAEQATKQAAKQICLAPPSAQIVSTDSAQASSAVRDVFSRYLSGPSLSVVPLKAPLASQARAEAQQSGCSYVLFTTVRHQSKVADGFL